MQNAMLIRQDSFTISGYDIQNMKHLRFHLVNQRHGNQRNLSADREARSYASRHPDLPYGLQEDCIVDNFLLFHRI